MNKKILIGIAATLGIIALIIVSKTLTQPDAYRVERSIEVTAPAAAAYAAVLDLQKWPEWSPWRAKDPAMEMTFSEETNAPGAYMTWKSTSEGSGKMTLTDANENQSLTYALEFYEPYQGTAATDMTFSEENGVTKIVWGMDGTNNGFMDKFFYSMMDFDSMIGADYEAGLSKLKETLEN